MPRPLTTCARSGCPELVERGFCPAHAKPRPKDTRPSAHARGYDRKWARTRGAYLYRHPVCETPGCDEKAEEVDHIDGLGPNGPQGHAWANLRALCKSHHSRRTARDQPGGWNRR